MATHQQAMDAANKPPSARSPREQQLVEQHRGDQRVRNADHAAKQNQRVYGPG